MGALARRREERALEVEAQRLRPVVGRVGDPGAHALGEPRQLGLGERRRRRQERGHALAQQGLGHAGQGARVAGGVVAAPAVDVDVDEARGDERSAGRRLVRLVGLDRRDPAVLDRDPAGDDAVGQHQAARRRPRTSRLAPVLPAWRPRPRTARRARTGRRDSGSRSPRGGGRGRRRSRAARRAAGRRGGSRAGARPRASRPRRRSSRSRAAGGGRRGRGPRAATRARGRRPSPRPRSGAAASRSPRRSARRRRTARGARRPRARTGRCPAPPPRRPSRVGSRGRGPARSARGPGAPSRARTSSAGRRGGGPAARRRSCRVPGSRTIKPSSASRCIALRAVIRLTPNSSHSAVSDGSGSPGSSSWIRSRSVRSIRRHRGTTGAGTHDGDRRRRPAGRPLRAVDRRPDRAGPDPELRRRPARRRRATSSGPAPQARRGSA